MKELLVNKAISSLASLGLPNIEKTVKIPVVGSVYMVLSNISSYHIDVPSSHVKPGETGISIIASGVTCNLSINWYYSYSTWFVPVKTSDRDRAEVVGMEVALTLGLENQEESLKLKLKDCGSNVKDISIKLDGGASWLYQGFQNQKAGANIFAYMTIDVLEEDEVIPMACISLVIQGTGLVKIKGNNFVGSIRLNDFQMSSKWSNIGNLRMYLIQPVVWTLIETIFLPYANARLSRGLPLPIIHGFILQNAEIILSTSGLAVCSDVAFADSNKRFLQLN
ncbi:putative BPI/LBP family protein [Glycine soja]